MSRWRWCGWGFMPWLPGWIMSCFFCIMYISLTACLLFENNKANVNLIIGAIYMDAFLGTKCSTLLLAIASILWFTCQSVALASSQLGTAFLCPSLPHFQLPVAISWQWWLCKWVDKNTQILETREKFVNAFLLNQVTVLI